MWSTWEQLRCPLITDKHTLNSRYHREHILQACQTSRDSWERIPIFKTQFLESRVKMASHFQVWQFFIATRPVKTKTPQDGLSRRSFKQTWLPSALGSMKDNILRLIKTGFKQHLGTQEFPNIWIISPDPPNQQMKEFLGFLGVLGMPGVCCSRGMLRFSVWSKFKGSTA